MKNTKPRIDKSWQKQVTLPVPPRGELKTLGIDEALQLAQKAAQHGNYGYAIHICEKVIAVTPKFPPPYYLQARAQLILGNKKQARELVMKALDMSTGNAEYFLHAGTLLGDLYENELSGALIEKAYAIDPANAQIATFYAQLLAKKGNTEEAASCLKKILAKHPSFASAWFMLSNLDIHKLTDEMLEKLNQLICSTSNNEQRVQLLFAAAKKYAQLGDIKSEFAHLDEGNSIIRSRSAWIWQNDYQDWQQISQKFTADFISGIAKTVETNIAPIILATLPRSGTTLIEQIISSHSDVCAAGESSLFHGPAVETSLSISNSLTFWTGINEINSNDFMEKYIQRVIENADEQHLKKPFITDKSIANYTSIGIILAAFPKAKVIYCKRDPRDICLSCYQHYFQDSLFYTCSLEDMARICVLFEQAMLHWKSVFPERILDIDYEDLVENTEEVTRKVLNFLGLEWQSQCLDFYKNKQIVHTASLQQVKQPINRRGLHRWKKYESLLKPAIETLHKTLDQ